MRRLRREGRTAAGSVHRSGISSSWFDMRRAAARSDTAEPRIACRHSRCSAVASVGVNISGLAPRNCRSAPGELPGAQSSNSATVMRDGNLSAVDMAGTCALSRWASSRRAGASGKAPDEGMTHTKRRTLPSDPIGSAEDTSSVSADSAAADGCAGSFGGALPARWHVAMSYSGKIQIYALDRRRRSSTCLIDGMKKQMSWVFLTVLDDVLLTYRNIV